MKLQPTRSQTHIHRVTQLESQMASCWEHSDRREDAPWQRGLHFSVSKYYACLPTLPCARYWRSTTCHSDVFFFPFNLNQFILFSELFQFSWSPPSLAPKSSLPLHACSTLSEDYRARFVALLVLLSPANLGIISCNLTPQIATLLRLCRIPKISIKWCDNLGVSDSPSPVLYKLQ